MSQRRDIHPLAVIALAALSIRVLAIIIFDRSPVSDEIDYLALARSLLSGDGYSLDGMPTAYRPPGYPTILAGLLGLSDGSLLFVRVFQAVIDTGTCLLVYDIGRRVFTEREAVIAATVCAVFPLHILYTGSFATETLFTFIVCLIVRSFLNIGIARGSVFYTGLLCGLAVLIRPVALFLPILSIFTNDAERSSKERLRFVGLVFAVMLVVLMPWLIRNLQTFGRLSVTSNAGVNLWIGNHSGANGAFSFPAGNPIDGIRDEFERSDEAVQRVKAFWREDPAEAIALLPRKFAHLFGIDYWVHLRLVSPSDADVPTRALEAFRRIPPLAIAVTHAPVIASCLLMLAGLFLSSEQTRSAVKPLAYLILAWVVIHLVFFGGARYRFPIHPAIILLAVHGWTLLRSRSYRVSRMRVVMGAIIGLMLLAGWSAELWILAT